MTAVKNKKRFTLPDEFCKQVQNWSKHADWKLHLQTEQALLTAGADALYGK
jgi:hypothetical protein